MKTLSTLACVLLLAGSVSAQNLNIAKQQAKRAAGTDSVPAGGSSPAAPNAPPPDPVLMATLQNIANLRADFQNLDTNGTNTLALKNDLSAAATGTKASPATIAKLAENLADAVVGNKKLQPHLQQVAQYTHAICNSSHLTAAQQQAVCAGVEKILTEAGVSAATTDKVVASFKTIAAETK